MNKKYLNGSNALGKPRFGDKRDNATNPSEAGCTSENSFSTMPRRKAA